MSAPILSQRAQAMPSSPIRKLVDLAVAAEERGVTVHRLNIGQPDIESPTAFWEAVGGGQMKVLEYSHSLGLRSLRDAVAAHYQRLQIPVSGDHVMVTTGGSEAVLMAFLACADPGDEIIVVEPFYANYGGFAIAAGAKLVPVTTVIEEDFALPRAEELIAKITPRTKAILLCNPSNPTGTAYSTSTLIEIAALAKQHNLFLIVDEVYRNFYYGAEKLTSVLQLAGMDQHAIMVDSASKQFSLCGARVGFLVTRNTELLGAALKFGQARLCSPTLDQLGVEACYIGTPPEYAEKVRAEYVSRRDLLVQRLTAMPGVIVPKIDGAFYAMVHLPVDDTDRFSRWMVERFEHDGQTVLLAPASGFYVTPGLGAQEVRIAYVLEKEKLSLAMDALAEGLRCYPGRILQS